MELDVYKPFTTIYFRFFSDMNERMATCVVGLHLEDGFTLTASLLEREIVRRRTGGEKVKGFLFCNPHNPLGVIYPRELILELMQVCSKYQVEFVMTFMHIPTLIFRFILYLTRFTLSPSFISRLPSLVY